MSKIFRSFLQDERGAAMAEYALLLGLIAVVVIATLTDVGTAVKTVFTTVKTKLASVPTQ